MDKREFLSALEQSLSVLQEDELKDIISEYEQHIDIKVEKGLTEEEAIEDFGSFQELTAELLEAYHVRADYALGGKKGGWAEKIRSQKKKKVTEEETSGVFEEGGEEGERGESTGTGRRMKRFRQVLSRVPETWRGFWKLAGRKKEKSPEKETGGKTREIRGFKRLGRILRRKGGRNMMRDGIGRGIRWTVRMTVCAVSGGVRLVWNSCWILFAFTAACFGLASLYGLGVLAVLLAQGYPLTGVTLGCLGLVMCMCSAAVFGMTMLKRGRRDVRKKGAVGERRSGADPEPEVKEDEISQWGEEDPDLSEDEDRKTEAARREEERTCVEYIR